MRTRTTTIRAGFTLLEVLLASAIGLFILYGLYLSIDVNLRFAEQGRTVVQEATLARSLSARISADLAPCVGQPDPTRYKQRNSTQPTTQPTTQPMTQPMSGGQTQPMTGTAQGMTTESEEPLSPDAVRAMQGDETTLSVFITRAPLLRAKSTEMMTTSDEEDEGINSDQRIIQYRFEEGKGLYRYEGNLSKLNMDGSVVTKGELIASEIKSLTFNYYDGTSWQTSWSGAELSPDIGTETNNNTPRGPPLAISVVMVIESPVLEKGKNRELKIRHVIAIPTAAGKAQLATDETLDSSTAPTTP